MKSFRQIILEVSQPKGGDEKDFKEKHVVQINFHPHAGNEVFKGAVKKFPKRRADYHKGDDEAVYEGSFDVSAAEGGEYDSEDSHQKYKKGNRSSRTVKETRKMDPVGQEDDDIDNDGDVDSSDKYLHARRRAISRAMKNEAYKPGVTVLTRTITLKPAEISAIKNDIIKAGIEMRAKGDQVTFKTAKIKTLAKILDKHVDFGATDVGSVLDVPAEIGPLYGYASKLSSTKGSRRFANEEVELDEAVQDTDYKYFKHHYNKWNTKYVKTGDHDADHYRMAIHHHDKMKKKATPGSPLHQALNNYSDVRGDVQRMRSVIAAKNDEAKFAKRKAMRNEGVEQVDEVSKKLLRKVGGTMLRKGLSDDPKAAKHMKSANLASAKLYPDQYKNSPLKAKVPATESIGLDEVLKPTTKMGTWIKDFQKSDAPQFKGKSQEKRRRMAIAAKYGAEREAGMREEVDELDEARINYNRLKTEEVHLDESINPRVIKSIHKDFQDYKTMSTDGVLKLHKSTKKVLNNYSAQDVGGKIGMVNDLLRNKHGDKHVSHYFNMSKKDVSKLVEEVEEVDEVTKTAIKKTVSYTGKDGKSHTRNIPIRSVERDEYGQDKIRENTSIEESFSEGMLKLKDGGSVIVKKNDADLLNQMFKDLSLTNRKKMLEVAMKDKNGFNEILGFAREAL